MPDLFEQLVGDYLTEKGYLCKFNVNYRKIDGKQTGSDIDVLAKRQKAPHDVIVGDCKSWVGGFWGDWLLKEPPTTSSLRERGRFKALFQKEWAEGLAAKVKTEFGTEKFTYTIYCARLRDASSALRNLKVEGNPVRVVTLDQMIRETEQRLIDRSEQTNSVEPTTLGRFVQLMRHAGIKLGYPDPP